MQNLAERTATHLGYSNNSSQDGVQYIREGVNSVGADIKDIINFLPDQNKGVKASYQRQEGGILVLKGNAQYTSLAELTRFLSDPLAHLADRDARMQMSPVFTKEEVLGKGSELWDDGSMSWEVANWYSNHYSMPYHAFRRIRGFLDLQALTPGSKVLVVSTHEHHSDDLPSTHYSIFGTIQKYEHDWLEIADHTILREAVDVEPKNQKTLSDRLRGIDSWVKGAFAINLTSFPGDPNLELYVVLARKGIQ